MRYFLLFFVCFPLWADPFEISLQMKDGFQYKVLAPPEDSKSHQLFSELPPATQKLFLEKRKLLLTSIATALHGIKTPIGFWRKVIRPRLDWLYGKSKPLLKPKKKFSETGHQTVAELIKGLDDQLWSKPEAVSRADEYGVALELGVSGGAKAGRRGFYGIAGLGLLASVDPLERAVSLELFGDIESAQRATPFYAGAGIFSTLMGAALSTNWKKPLQTESGCAFCTLGVVGLISDRYLAAGVSKELGLGFPGAVLMESNLSRVPFFKIGVSPRWRGFVRVQSSSTCVTAFKKLKQFMIK